jgi:hypothetical protein
MEPPRKALSYQRFFGFEPKSSNPPKTLWLSELTRQKKNSEGYFYSALFNAWLSAISTMEFPNDHSPGAVR